MVKLPSQMATWLSPNGSVKKHNLYSKHPRAWESKAHVNPVAQTNAKDRIEQTPEHTESQQIQLLLYFQQERLRLVSLTQISAFVVMILLLYRFTISGARYDRVVYLPQTFGRIELNKLLQFKLTFSTK